jgi:ribose transport system ATP-binding protein
MHDFGKALFGALRPDYGEVTLADGTKVTSTGVAVKKHMAYISKNRDTEALMSAGSVKDNICLPNLSKLKTCGLISPRKEMELAERWGKTLSIKMQSPKQYCMYLSGGNKQKVSIAKWLASEAEIYIFDCPTRGIDIGVKADIYQLLADLKKQGKAILMISEELPELIGMSDRILTFKNGEISGEFFRDPSITEHTLIDYMI